MNDEELIKDFIIECNEGLSKLDYDLLLLEKQPDDEDVLKSIFRASSLIWFG